MVRAIISSYQLLSYSILHFDFFRNFSIERNLLRKMVYIIRQCQMNNTLEWGIFRLKNGCRVWKAEFESFLIKSVVFMATERDFFPFFHLNVICVRCIALLRLFVCIKRQLDMTAEKSCLQCGIAPNTSCHLCDNDEDKVEPGMSYHGFE